MHSKKVVITAQVLLSGMIAFLMTGFFATLHLGLTAAMADAWIGSFVIAWPVAIVFSLAVSPLAFMVAGRMLADRVPADAEVDPSDTV